MSSKCREHDKVVEEREVLVKKYLSDETKKILVRKFYTPALNEVKEYLKGELEKSLEKNEPDNREKIKKEFRK